jgi:hypothetical protein
MIFKTSSFKRRFQLRQPRHLHSVLLSCIFYRRSFATVTSLLQLHQIPYALPTFNTLLLQPENVRIVSTVIFFFIKLLCEIELDDTRRA